jgi:hypothetical protein
MESNAARSTDSVPALRCTVRTLHCVHAITKNYPQLLDLTPTVTGGAAATDINDASEAYNKLTAMAEELHRRSPTLTTAQAFARVFEDQANAELAAKAHRRPSAATSYAFPR